MKLNVQDDLEFEQEANQGNIRTSLVTNTDHRVVIIFNFSLINSEKLILNLK